MQTMARTTVVQYIQENICVIRKLVSIGKVPQSVLNEYQIYAFYQSLSHMPSKMDRYEFTAESLKTNVTTVRNAVRLMEKAI